MRWFLHYIVAAAAAAAVAVAVAVVVAASAVEPSPAIVGTKYLLLYIYPDLHACM